jgi:hypothetical protein
MTEPIVCGHPTPNGPCTRKVLPGAGGCGYHPDPPDSPEQRHPEPMASCQCQRPLVCWAALKTTPRCAASSALSPSQSSWPKRAARDRLTAPFKRGQTTTQLALTTAFYSSCSVGGSKHDFQKLRPGTWRRRGRSLPPPYTDDEALRLAFTETMTRAAEIAKERVGICQRLMEIAAICRESNRSVQIEAIAQTERRVRQLAEQPPTSAGGE